jgi:heparanase 1
MKKYLMLFVVALTSISAIFGFIGWSPPNGTGTSNNADTVIITVNLKEMKYLGSVDERYQSYNVEMAEVVGGEFWRPYKTMDSLPSSTSSFDFSNRSQMFRKLPPINLADKRLMNLAKALAPAYVRVSGSWANTVYFQNNDSPQIKAPEGFVNTLTRSQWKGVIDFVKATHSKLVTSFAVSKGVRDPGGVWTAKEAQKIINYTKSIGGKIAGAELFNEPTIPIAAGVDTNYNGRNFAKDIAIFRAWAKKEAPDMLLIGPGSTAEGIPGQSFAGMLKHFISTDSLMSPEPKPLFDIFSYHYYGAMSMRIMRGGPFSIKAENALDSGWLQRTDVVADYYIRLRDEYNPGKPVWLTETAEASQGGDPFAATYLDCFRYLYQLGSLAKKGVQVVMHNTLAASEYSLVDQDTHLPKPNYWAALLWAKLMGTKVYEAGKGAPGVYLFAHNMKGHNDGITLLVLNTNKASATINIASGGEQYTLSSNDLQSDHVQLNGQDLKLSGDDMLPAIKGEKINAGNVELPATSITFITFESAGK